MQEEQLPWPALSASMILSFLFYLCLLSLLPSCVSLFLRIYIWRLNIRVAMPSSNNPDRQIEYLRTVYEPNAGKAPPEHLIEYWHS